MFIWVVLCGTYFEDCYGKTNYFDPQFNVNLLRNKSHLTDLSHLKENHQIFKEFPDKSKSPINVCFNSIT